MPEGLTIGVDIGGTKVAAALVSETGEIAHKTRGPMNGAGTAAEGFAAVAAIIEAPFPAYPMRAPGC